jgi:PhnB protein
MSKQSLIDQLDRAIGEILANAAVVPGSVDPPVAELLPLAHALHHLPTPQFKARLKADLERSAVMSAKAVVSRPGFRSVTPYLLVPGAEFLDFVKDVFSAEVTAKMETGPGSFHSEVRIGDSMLMIGAGAARKMPVLLSVYTPDADEVYKRALAAGCKALEDVHESYGDRYGCVEDPGGNQWVIATHLGSSYIREGRSSVTVDFVADGGGRFVDFVKLAFGAEELARHEWPGGFYASVKVGDSYIGVSEPKNHEWMRPMQAMVYLYVSNCDAVYEQAIRAGAKSITPLADQVYGDRNGGVEDEWGNQWFIATRIR